MKPRNVQGRAVAVHARGVRGFSLLELMGVLVIIGVLTAIAWPSYQNYVIRANRAAAQTFMMTVASRQEQYLLTNRSYTATISDLGGLTQPSETAGRYTFAVEVPALAIVLPAPEAAIPAPSYRITATAIGNQVSDGNLTLSSGGVKLPTDKWKR